jgi:hypothetical protein
MESRELQVNKVIAEYLTAVEAGKAPNFHIAPSASAHSTRHSPVESRGRQ